MAFDGWFRFNGTEVVNTERTVTYARAVTSGLTVRDCSSCDGLRWIANMPEDGLDVDERSAYRTPFLDNPDWVDYDDADTLNFAGFFPTSISGIEDSGLSAEVTQATRDGGFVSKPRRAAKEVRFAGVLLGANDRANSVGLRWLTRTLSRQAGNECDSGVLEYFSACPDCLNLEGYDYTKPPARGTSQGGSLWRAVGGSYVKNGDGTGTYTPSAGSYLEFSPMNAVCDPMSLTVLFSDGLRNVQRTNFIKNPSYRAKGPGQSIRTNLIENPRATDPAGWAVAGTASTSLYSLSTGEIDPGLMAAFIPPGNVTTAATLDMKAGIQVNGMGFTVTRASGARFPVVEGKTYTASAHVVSSPQRSWKVIFDCYNALGGLVTSAGATSATQNPYPNWEFSRIWHTFEIPSGVVSVALRFVIADTATPATATFVMATGVMLERSSLLDGYFDGSITNYNDYTLSWEGVPNRSASIEREVGSINSLGAVEDERFYGIRGGTPSYTIRFRDVTPTNTVVAKTSPSMAPAAPGQFFGGSFQGFSSSCQLSVVAYDADFVSLGAITSSSSLVSGRMTTSGSTAAPAGTAYVGLVVNLTAAHAPGDTIFIDDVLLERLSGPVAVGPYFDGSTTDTLSIDYYWSGLADASASIAADPITTTAANVTLSAYGDGVLVASTSGLSSEEITLTVDGEPYDVISWRLTANKEVIIASQTWEFRVPVDGDHQVYVEKFNCAACTETITNWPDGRAPADLVLARAERYRRTLRNITFVEGPTVLRRKDTCDYSVWNIEFTAVAARPFQFSGDVPVGSAWFGSVPYTIGPDSELWESVNAGKMVNSVIADCPDRFETGPVVDASCAPTPAPPTIPNISSLCLPDPGPVTQRISMFIDPDGIPNWADMVPILRISPDRSLTKMRVRFYPVSGPDVNPSTLDPCSVCAGFSIHYVPKEGLVIDAASQVVYSREMEIVGGVTTGRSYDRPALHLMSSLSNGPFEWPVLNCGGPYMAIFEFYDAVEVGQVEVIMVGRE